MRVAIIDNLSAAAYRLSPLPLPAQVIHGSPSATAAWMTDGACDAALVPVAALPQLTPQTVCPGAYGIACEGAVSSVLLFARMPLSRILRQGLPIYVSPQSLSSRQLLNTLCRMSGQAQPLLTNDPCHAAARLLIGDQAADSTREEHDWPGVYDLAQWWYQATGWPFVFARWVIRRDMPAAERQHLLDWLESAATWAETEAGQQLFARDAVDRGLLHGSIGHARRYYTRVRPRLGMRDLRGLELFLNLQEKESSCAKIA